VIETDRLLRLLYGIIGDPTERDFGWMAREGFSFHPSLDMEDIATFARIASGEAWEAFERRASE
jgi:hypothetical protein